ncbi:quinone oxidoreductase 1, partial [Escherichia coli 8.0586]
QGSSLLIP